MIVISKILARIIFLGHPKQVKHQKQIKTNHTCKLKMNVISLTLTNGINPLKSGTY